MSTPIVLTPHQCNAVSYVVEHLMDGDPVVAIKGYAGTGKSSLLPALIDVLESQGIPCTVGAPTHRAAMVLRRKGLEGADTVHSHALVTYFDGDYTRAIRWLGEDCQCKVEALANSHPHVDGVAWLIAERLRMVEMPPEALKSRARQYGARRALESIGISGRSHMVGYGPKAGEGCLIIDEGSMVGTDMLALCRQAYPMICLVGDPGQLPPVKDGAQLEGVPGYQLTELHRQAADSAIIQLAYAARSGKKFWESMPSVAGQVEEYTAVDASAFLHSPLIVWRNKTRLECTAAIRAALGYPAGRLQAGEPLVCRSTDARDRADGFFNNSLWRVFDAAHDNPRKVLVQRDGQDDAELQEILVHMEEVDGANVDPDAILMRWGYTLTCHTAQGGEWPTVYISKPDLFAHSKRSPQEGEEDDFARWAYTAITRAKQTLGFLRKHDFTTTTSAAPAPWVLPHVGDDDMPRMQQQPKVAPPSAPMLGNALPEPDDDIDDAVLPAGMAEELMASPTPGLPDAAYGPEPVETRITTDVGVACPPGSMTPALGRAVQSLTAQRPLEAPSEAQEPFAPATPPSLPPTVPTLPDAFLPLAHGFCQYLQGVFSAKLEEAAIGMTKEVSATIDGMAHYAQGVLQSNEHVGYQMSDALLKVQEHGLTVHGSPYEMQLQVYTPAGVPLTLTIRKTSAAELLDELTRLETWLSLNNYTGEKTEGVAA